MTGSNFQRYIIVSIFIGIAVGVLTHDKPIGILVAIALILTFAGLKKEVLANKIFSHQLMHELLKKYLLTNAQFSSQKIEEIAGSFISKTAKKGEILLSAGEVSRELYFVNKGCIRTFYLSRSGKERTRYIALNGMIGTSLTSFITQKSSFEFVDVIEHSELLCISHSNFYKLVDTVDEWAKFYRQLLESAYSYQNKRIENLVTLTAGERYADLMQNHAQYIQRLPNHILASYLDMSQETLSRLKSK